MLQRLNNRRTKAMQKFNLRQLQISRLYYKKNFCKTTTLYRCYRPIKILIIKSYLLKSMQKDVNFRRNKIFMSLKQKKNLLKNLFVKTKLKCLVCIAFTKTILITKTTN